MATDVFGVVFRGRVESSQCRGESEGGTRRRRILNARLSHSTLARQGRGLARRRRILAVVTLHPTLKSLRGGGVPSSHPSLGLCVFLCTRLAHL